MNLQQFRKECLEAHNDCRRSHGAPPLQELGELNDFAQEWANTMAKTGQFKHSEKDGYGENIAYAMRSSGPTVTGYEITQMWYDEVHDYNFETHKAKSPGKVIGHFTQVVWKGTTHAGFGIAKKGETEYYAVGSYKPPGNMTMPGYFKENVGVKTSKLTLPELRDSPKEDAIGSKPSAPSGGSDDSGTGERPKLGTSVKTTEEFFTEGNERKKKTTIVTTTVTKQPDGSIKTTVSTSARIESVTAAKPATDVSESLDNMDLSSEEPDEDEDEDTKKIPGNLLTRPTMKAFRKSFLEQVNVFRDDKGIARLVRDKALQKLAQKCANAAIKGKTRRDEVRSALRITFPKLPNSGEAGAKLFAQRGSADTSDMFDNLMSGDFGVMGIGVSSKISSGDDTSELIIYLG